MKEWQKDYFEVGATSYSSKHNLDDQFEIEKKTNNSSIQLLLLQPFRKGETYPADCRKLAAVDSNKHDWD